MFLSALLPALTLVQIVAIPKVKGLPAPHPYAISGDGRTVIGQFAPGNPFIWRGRSEVSRFRPNSDVNVLDHYAQSINFDGSIIVGKSGSGYRWSRSGGLFLFDKKLDSFAYGVSADGMTVTGQIQEKSGQSGFIWTKRSGLKRIPEFAPTAISANGKVVCGIAINKGETYAFDWQDGFSQPLPTPDTVTDSSAFAVSEDGSVIVGSVTEKSGTSAVKWVNGKIEKLSNLGGTDALGKCITYDGSYVGGYAGDRAAIWDSNGKGFYLDSLLRSPGWKFESVNGIAKVGKQLFLTGWGRLNGAEMGYWVSFKIR